jgi:molybdate transport system permease protein
VIDWVPFWVSAQLGLWVTGILLVIGFPLAWLFAFSRRGWVVWLESVFSLPLVLAPTVMGFYLLLLLSPQNGLGRLFQDWFGIRLAFSFPAIVFAGCVSALPSMLTGLKTGLLGVPVSLLEASATLGKGPLETFFRIVLPQMRGGVLAGVILTFAHTLGEFGVVLMIGGSLPGITKVVSIAIYERVESLDFGTAHLYALVLVAIAYPLVVALNLLQRRQARRTS